MERGANVRRWGLTLLIAVAGCGAESQDIAPPGPVSDAGSVFVPDAGSSAPGDAAFPSADAGQGSIADGGLPVDQCDPVTQSGCGGQAAKCVVEGPAPGATCVSRPDDELGLGDACEGLDCAPGLACARETDTATVSRCVQVCHFESGNGCEPLGEDFECRARLSGTNWGACRALPAACDALSQAPCDRSEACQPFLRRSGSREFRCREAGLGEEGQACGTQADVGCQRGLACVSTREGAAFCRRICETNADCANRAQCAGVVNEPPFMYCRE